MDEVHGQIFDKLEAVHRQVTQLVKWQAVHAESHKHLHEWIQKMDNTLYANGGLRDRVMRLWNCKNDLTIRLTTWQRFYSGILKALIVAGICAIAAWSIRAYSYMSGHDSVPETKTVQAQE